MSDSLPKGVHFQIPNLGNYASRLCTKKWIQDKNNKKTTCVTSLHGCAFLVLSYILKWKLSEAIHDTKLASTGRSIMPWLEVNANETVTRNLKDITLKDTAESAAKVILSNKTPRLSG